MSKAPQPPKLKEAREAIDKKNYSLALECVNEVLEYESENYNALIFKGIALFNLAQKAVQQLKQSVLSSGASAAVAGSAAASKASAVAKKTGKVSDDLDKEGASFVNAVAAYQAAIKVNAKLPLAWQGLSEIYTALLPANLGSTGGSSFSKGASDLVASAPSKLVDVCKTLITLTPYA